MAKEQQTDKIELSREDAFFVAGLLSKVRNIGLVGLSNDENKDLYFKATDVFTNIMKQLND